MKAANIECLFDMYFTEKGITLEIQTYDSDTNEILFGYTEVIKDMLSNYVVTHSRFNSMDKDDYDYMEAIATAFSNNADFIRDNLKKVMRVE